MESASNPAENRLVGGLPPPPGVVPDFNNPALGYVIVSFAICLIVTTLVVWVRMYTVFFVIKSHGWADYTSFLAWIGYLGFCTADIVGMHLGSGSHQWNVKLKDAIRLLKLVNYVEISYGPIIFLAKLSILLQIRRLFVSSSKDRLRTTIDAIIWFNALFYFADTFVEIFQCVPRNKIFNPKIPGRCVNINNAILATACINIASDVSIFVLPLIRIWRLQLPLRQKLGVSTVFTFGLFACLASIARLVASIQFAKSMDLSYGIMRLGLWCDAEIGCGIVCGCLPLLPAFFRHLTRKSSKAKSHVNTHNREKAHASSNPTTDKRVVAWGDPSKSKAFAGGGYVEMDDLEADRWPRDA